MGEVAVARFSLRWEADFAKGFLDDAGIPCRVMDDGSVGLSSYTGDIQGAVLLVPEQEADAARQTLEDAGVLESEESAAKRMPPLAERDLPPVMRADVRDINEQLALAKRRTLRHGIFAVIGMTPAALIPLTGLLIQGNGALVAALCVLVGGREIWRWVQAGKEVTRLELLLMDMEDEADGERGVRDFSG